MHTSISDCEFVVILVGSVINWLSPYMSKMLVKFAELWSDVSGNKLQFRSPNRYNSLFSASIFPTSCSKELNISEGDWGGLYQVLTKNGLGTSKKCAKNVLKILY